MKPLSNAIQLMSFSLIVTSLMKIVKERVGQLQDLAKDKGGDIASKATEKASQMPGMDKVCSLSRCRTIVIVINP